MVTDLLEACQNLAESLQPFYSLVRVASVFTGFALMGFALLGMKRASEERRTVLPHAASLFVGALLASFTAVVDALTRSVFAESAPEGLSSVSVGSVGGLEAMVELAIVVVMLVGAYQVVKGFIMLKEAAFGGHNFWPAATHILGGVLCFNIRTFMLTLGNTMGGTLDEVVRTLLGS